MSRRKKKKRSAKLGLMPGSMVLIGEQKEEKVKIALTDYNAEQYEFKQLHSIDEAFAYRDKPTVTWINICGLHDPSVIEKIGQCYDIHPLILEDILNTEQRPKVETFDKYVFAIIKMISYQKTSHQIDLDQVSFILTANSLITFQERESRIFDPICDRIEQALGRIRRNGADDLMYALMDIVVDHYFLALEQVQERLDDLEESFGKDGDKMLLEHIHQLNRQLIFLRRSIWPLRDVLHGLISDEHPLIDDTSLPFFHDLYDHSIQAIEMIDTSREVVNGMMNTYLSMMSNRMNEVMKVLTIISTIFIPLSFIVGIYGMNFEFMPELKWKLGYFAVWGIILGTFMMMTMYFKRKKWF
jgi:magnesium transporter